MTSTVCPNCGGPKNSAHQCYDLNKLAQRIVALGVGSSPDVPDERFRLWYLGLESFEAEQFCNDGRVVLV